WSEPPASWGGAIGPTKRSWAGDAAIRALSTMDGGVVSSGVVPSVVAVGVSVVGDVVSGGAVGADGLCVSAGVSSPFTGTDGLFGDGACRSSWPGAPPLPGGVGVVGVGGWSFGSGDVVVGGLVVVVGGLVVVV